jgi:septal ring factor EnvC (AmiA/AmiB activator)
MDEKDFQKKLAELVAEIGTLPESEQAKLESLVEETKERHESIREAVSKTQEGLDFLRLSIKYLLFDLEATRRENKQLRKSLEEGGEKDDTE